MVLGYNDSESLEVLLSGENEENQVIYLKLNGNLDEYSLGGNKI